jgi:hypothetical protein
MLDSNMESFGGRAALGDDFELIAYDSRNALAYNWVIINYCNRNSL